MVFGSNLIDHVQVIQSDRKAIGKVLVGFDDKLIFGQMFEIGEVILYRSCMHGAHKFMRGRAVREAFAPQGAGGAAQDGLEQDVCALYYLEYFIDDGRIASCRVENDRQALVDEEISGLDKKPVICHAANFIFRHIQPEVHERSLAQVFVQHGPAQLHAQGARER